MNPDEIAAEARGLLGNPVLQALLTSMEASAASKVVTHALGDDAALRHAAVEMKVVRNVRTRLAQMARKEADDGR